MVTRRKQSHRKTVVLAMVALCVLPMLAVGFLDAGWASAGSHDMGATTFGLARQSAENPNASDVSPDTVQDKSDADVLAVEDVAEEAALKTASSRDVSAGVQEIADEEEAARLAAEEAARVAEQEAIDRADATRSRYYATFGSLPAGDVDFSIGREAFIEEWSARINDYLFGSPLSGYGESTKGRVCFKSHNAWGWDQTNWPDWDTAIRSHVAGLARGYGFTISYSYAMRYCPPNYDNWYRDTLNQMQLI